MGAQLRRFTSLVLPLLLGGIMMMGLQQGASETAPTCGFPRPITRMAGGVNAQQGDWPWQVSLQYQGLHLCGGSLINDRWILTASHCFIDDVSEVRPEDWKVVLGRVKLSGGQMKGLVRKVVQIITHEGYVNFRKGNDIALVRLDPPVKFSRDVAPVCLPYADHRFAFGTQCWISGWGDISMNETLPDPKHLQEMSLDLLTPDTCNCIYNNLRDRKIVRPALPGMVCAMTPDRKRGPCKGDSGGPMVCLENGRWFQAGIMSFSMGCGRFYGPIFLTETTTYYNWIHDHVQEATFAKQLPPLPDTTDKYMCTGCGTLKTSNSSKGAEGLWPWYVSLQHKGQHVCGGTLIAEDWVVTSAQCFIGRQETEGWEVLLGEQQVKEGQQWLEKRSLQKIILHAAYVNMTEGEDIAAAMFSRPVEFNDSIRAICVPYESHQFPFGSTCWTRGRRIVTDNKLGSPEGVEVKLVGPRNCNCLYNQTSNLGEEIPITSNMLCAAPHNSTNRCEESIGDPLICNEKGSWFLAGIASFGRGCGTVIRPGVYTAASAYQEWIMGIAWSAYYDIQTDPRPEAKDDDTCLNVTRAGHT